MKTKLPFFSRFSVVLLTGFASLLVVSCGSYQNSSYYDNDGIYGDYERSNTPVQNKYSEENLQNGEAYAQKFRMMREDMEYFTDVDTYSSETQNDTVVTVYNNQYNDDSRYAGWGSNSNGNVTVNYYNSGWNNWYSPYWGYYNSPYWGGWNSWYGPSWGWGWNSWYGPTWGWGWNSWYSPYWYGGGYYPYYGNYYYGGGRNVSYYGGTRGARVGNYNNGRSSYVNGTRSRGSFNTSRNNINQPRNYNSTQPRTNTSQPRNYNNTQPRTNTSQPRSTNSTPRTYSPNNNNSYSTPRSNSGSYSTPRSSSGSFGGSRGGGSFGGGGRSGGSFGGGRR